MGIKVASLVLMIGVIGLWAAPLAGAVLLVTGGIGLAIAFESMVSGASTPATVPVAATPATR